MQGLASGGQNQQVKDQKDRSSRRSPSFESMTGLAAGCQAARSSRLSRAFEISRSVEEAHEKYVDNGFCIIQLPLIFDEVLDNLLQECQKLDAEFMDNPSWFDGSTRTSVGQNKEESYSMNCPDNAKSRHGLISMSLWVNMCARWLKDCLVVATQS